MAEDETIEDTEATGQENSPLRGSDIPWQAMEILESLPDDEVVVGFIQAQTNCIVITKGGFYGHYDGSVQRLPMKLIDNS